MGGLTALLGRVSVILRSWVRVTTVIKKGSGFGQGNCLEAGLKLGINLGLNYAKSGPNGLNLNRSPIFNPSPDPIPFN